MFADPTFRMNGEAAMTQRTPEYLEKLLQHSIDCWNNRDRDAFMEAYRKLAPGKLTIEYVGKQSGDGWAILDNMWETTNAIVDIEVVKKIVNGDEVACHNINKMPSKNMTIHTIELFKFDGDDCHIRYFIRPEPA